MYVYTHVLHNINVSLAVLFGSNGNSYTVFTESDMYVYTHVLHNINAGRAKKKKWDSSECRVP